MVTHESVLLDRAYIVAMAVLQSDLYHSGDDTLRDAVDDILLLHKFRDRINDLPIPTKEECLFWALSTKDHAAIINKYQIRNASVSGYSAIDVAAMFRRITGVK